MSEITLVVPQFSESGVEVQPIKPSLDIEPDISKAFSKPKFYADSETLKEGSGYYSFMNALPASQDMWVENCCDCKKPMSKIMMKPGIHIEAIAESDRGMSATKNFWSLSYHQFREDPSLLALNPSSEYWICKDCKGIWTSAPGFWLRVKINGESLFSLDRINATNAKLTEEKIKMAELPFDPGPKPTPNSTQCPNCHSWRSIEPYESYPGDGLNRTLHVCPKCKTGDVIEPVLDETKEFEPLSE